MCGLKDPLRLFSVSYREKSVQKEDWSRPSNITSDPFPCVQVGGQEVSWPVMYYAGPASDMDQRPG